MELILIDPAVLAKDLAQEEFTRTVEINFKFHEMYEQVDETERWYMKDEFVTILHDMEEKWEEKLLHYQVKIDKTKTSIPPTQINGR